MRTPARPRRVALRHEERVSALELFFDLVFVLAVTQCSALMAREGTWRGIAQGLVVLGLLWWSWVGYAWLTSVVDPEEGGVRMVLFAAMAALLVASLCVPDAFGDRGLILVVAYASVRAAHIVLFLLASRDDPELRHSVLGLAFSTAIGSAALLVGALLGPDARLAVWAAALAFDMAGPVFIDTSGWRLVPGHFAERHGLVVIIGLGESIVAIGAGAAAGIDGEVIVAAVIGTGVAAALWWVYFDAVSLAAAARLATLEPVKARNELARDAYSYLHLPMVAAIVLVALGMERTLHDLDAPLAWESVAVLVGGAAVYLLAQVAFKVRCLEAGSPHRVVAAAVLVAGVPFARRVDAIVVLGAVAAVLWALVLYEFRRYRDTAYQLRHANHSHEDGAA